MKFPGGWAAVTRRAAGPALLLAAAAVAVAPLAVHGPSCGHDFDFHLVSWLDAQNAWRQGIPYPHWTSSANFGAGEPRFVFYPPLTWMLGAALGFVLPWHIVPVVLTFLLLAATGLATRALARLVLPQGAATLAGCAALFSGYALFTAYERTAFAELAGGFWIPLVLLFILRDRNQSESLWLRTFDGSVIPLTLAVAGAWFSNAPVGVMACYLLAATALVHALANRSLAPLLRAAISTTLALGLAALYLVPAAWEQAWVDIRQVTQDPGEMIENSWLLARHADPALELHDIELMRVSVLGITMIAVALGGFFLLWKSGILKRKQWIPVALIPVAVLFLMLPISLPVWNALPKLRFLQFPWRWLVVLEAPMGILFAGALWLTRRWRRIAAVTICAAAFIGATEVASLFFFQSCDDEDAVPGMLAVYRAGKGFEGTDEYTPRGADNSLLASGLPAACLVGDPLTVLGYGAEDTIPAWDASQGSCDIVLPAAERRSEHLRIHGNLPRGGYLILRLRSYPAWKFTVNGRPAAPGPRRDDGLVTVPVAPGPVDLAADWKITPDVIAGRAITAFSVLLLTLLCVVERRLNRPRLS